MRSLRSPRVLALLPRRDLSPQLFVWEDFLSLPTSASTPARVTCSSTTRAPRAAPTPLRALLSAIATATSADPVAHLRRQELRDDLVTVTTLSAQLEARCVVRDGLDLRLRGEALR